MHERTGLSVWKADGTDLGNYKSVYVGQPEVFIASDSQYKGIEPDQGCLGAAIARVPDSIDATGKSWDELGAEVSALAKRFDGYWSKSHGGQ